MFNGVFVLPEVFCEVATDSLIYQTQKHIPFTLLAYSDRIVRRYRLVRRTSIGFWKKKSNHTTGRMNTDPHTIGTEQQTLVSGQGAVQFQGEKCCFLGGGKMASAIIRGLVASGFMDPKQITVSSSSFTEELQAMQIAGELGITLTEIGSEKGVKDADLVVIAVKPASIAQALEANSEYISSNQLFLSVCAGTSCGMIEEVSRYTIDTRV